MATHRHSEHFGTGWYLLLAAIATSLMVLSVGGGLFAFDSDHFYHRLCILAFDGLCHQQPSRSLMVNGVAMAVCSRCFGIYTSFGVGILLFPLLPALGLPYQRSKALAYIVVSLAVITIDFIGNFFGMWTNTHQSRIILGTLFGTGLAWLLAGEFTQTLKKRPHGNR